MGGRRGAATSLVQQPQEEARTAVALTAMASNRRVMLEVFLSSDGFWESIFDPRDQKTPPGFKRKWAGLKPNLLGWCLVSWCWSWSWCAWAAGSGEERCDGGDDCKFDHVHDVVLYLVVLCCVKTSLMGDFCRETNDMDNGCKAKGTRCGMLLYLRLSAAFPRNSACRRRPIHPAIRRCGRLPACLVRPPRRRRRPV